MLPNIAPVVLAQSTINFGYALIDLAGLSFLGLGVPAADADWGAMVIDGQTAICRASRCRRSLPALAIVLTVVAFNVVGERWADRLAERDGVMSTLPSSARSGTAPDACPARPARPRRRRPARRRGETVALVGESGSGKSLTSRSALGLFPPGAAADGHGPRRGRTCSSMTRARCAGCAPAPRR